eukprot:scaffold303_cov285-Chaetoceros_neogracile.AAC.8
MKFTSSKTLLAILTYLIQLQPSFQFASWFVDRQSSCWVSLRDTTEVVMNNFIVTHEQSSEPNVSIELFDQDSNLIITKDDGDHDGGDGDRDGIHINKRVVYIEDLFTADKTSDFGQRELKWSGKITAKLNLEGTDLKDVQYIMDLKVSPELEDDVIHKITDDETRMQARFLSSSSGCNEYRAHGRGNDNGLTFQVGFPSSVFNLNNVEENSVDLVAGWATGHAAVTLTQSIVFRTRNQSPYKSKSKNEADANPTEGTEEQEKVILEPQIEPEEEELLLAEDTPNDYQSEGERMVREEMNSEADEEGEHAHGPTKKEKDKHQRFPKEEDFTMKRITKFRKKYETDGFGNAEFTTRSYIAGLIVMIIVGGTIMNAFVSMSGKSRSKRGKREL